MTPDENRLAALLDTMQDETRPRSERTAAAIEALPMVHRMPNPIRAEAAGVCLQFAREEAARFSKRG